MLLEIFIASFIVMLAALGGALTFWKTIGQAIEKRLGVLISFTAGLFLFVSYELGYEAILHAPSVANGLAWIVGGMVMIWFIFQVLPHFHEHEAIQTQKEKNTLSIRKILTGNGIHNIGDGILLAATFSVDLRLGIITTLSVFIHELVQETSIFFLLRKAGYTIKRAVIINFTVSGTILIGSIGGALSLSAFKALETPLLGLSAGAFLIVVLQDLVPHSFHESLQNKCFFAHIFAFFMGLALMLSLSLIFPHTHEHDHHHYHESEHHEHHHKNHSH